MLICRKRLLEIYVTECRVDFSSALVTSLGVMEHWIKSGTSTAPDICPTFDKDGVHKIPRAAPHLSLQVTTVGINWVII